MRMVEILPSHVREWVSKLTREGVRPPALQYCMVILSAIFTTALNDQVTFLHPCKGVKTPPVPKKARQIITPEQFDALHKALPEGNIRLGDRYRKRPAMGRADRAPGQGFELRHPDPHGQPGSWSKWQRASIPRAGAL